MENTQLFDGIEFLKTLSLLEFFMFFIYLSLIFALRSFLVFLVKQLGSSKRFNKRIFPMLEDLMNWLAIYSAILFFLFYFSEEQWLFYPFYETDGIKISVFLVVVVAIVVNFASHLVKAFNRFVMPFFYKQFGVDESLSYTFNRVIYYVVIVDCLSRWVHHRWHGFDSARRGLRRAWHRHRFWRTQHRCEFCVRHHHFV